MSWPFSKFNDGDGLDALEAQFQAAEDYLNDIPDTALRSGTFNRHHAMQIVPIANSAYHGTLSTLTPVPHVYDWATFSTEIEYAAYGQDGNTDRMVVGDTRTASGKSSEVAISIEIGMDNATFVENRCEALLLLGNVHVVSCVPGGTGAYTPTIMCCFQYQVNAAWYTIEHSERFLTVDDHYWNDPATAATTAHILNYDIPLAALLTEDLLAANATPATDTVTGIRMMCSLRTQGVGTGYDANTQFTLAGWNQSVIGLFAGDVA